MSILTTNHNKSQLTTNSVFTRNCMVPQQRRANATQLITAHLVWKDSPSTSRMMFLSGS